MFSQTFQREGLTWCSLNHPNILPFLGIYRENNESYPLMVLPYLEHGSLDDILEQTPVDFVVNAVRLARGQLSWYYTIPY